MNDRRTKTAAVALVAWLLGLGACGSHRAYQNREMDFGAVKTVAVLPFSNLSKDSLAAERVRDVFSNMLLATQAVYVLPPGEVARGVARLGLGAPSTPSSDEVVKLGGLLKVDAVITGVVKEYGEVRSANAVANVVALSVQMQETQTGKVVFAASSTKGGIGWASRLLGTAGGDPVNDVTEQAVDDVLHKLFN
jgi:polysaccharide biosynthesis protein PelC